MGFSQGLSTFFPRLQTPPMERKLYSVISQENVVDEDFAPAPIQPNEDYFSIRLCEMYLKEARTCLQEFVPMAILVTDFQYAREKETLPFIVDNKMLGQDVFVGNQYIELKNTRVAGPFPYAGGDVGLFIGLFQLEVSNMAKTLFNLVETLAKTFDPSGLSKYLPVAKSLGQSLPDVLGMKECQFRLGARDCYTETQGAANQFRNNYMAYVNCQEQDFDAQNLWVKKNQLYSGTDPEDLAHFSAHDYCLIKIERSQTRQDYPCLSFYPLWKEAHNLLLEKAFDKAAFRQVEFLQQINTCPDLTELHKEELILLYSIKFKKLKEQMEDNVKPDHASRGETRRPAPAPKDRITPFLQSTAAMADSLKLPERVGKGLFHLTEAWKTIPLPDNTDPEFNAPETNADPMAKEQAVLQASQAINHQLAALKKVRQKGDPNPSGLVQALARTMLKK